MGADVKPHVILIADAGPGIGWGHAVRQYALAEALVARQVPTLFVTRTREALALDWPCPVWVVADVEQCELPSGRWASKWARVVYDLPEPVVNALALGPTMRFADYGPTPTEDDYVVCPNFAATSHEWGVPALLGPRWAPLRSRFMNHEHNGRQGGVYVYGDAPELPKEMRAVRASSFHARGVAATMAGCSLALVPPSMVALECLAIRLPVVLYVPGPKWQPIADAMVQAGVAEVWTGNPDDYTLACVLADDGKRRRMSEAGREAVDGMGAERLAGWLSDA